MIQCQRELLDLLAENVGSLCDIEDSVIVVVAYLKNNCDRLEDGEKIAKRIIMSMEYEPTGKQINDAEDDDTDES